MLLGLAALAFARAGDTAQAPFFRLVAAAPYAPLVLTPSLFAAVVYITHCLLGVCRPRLRHCAGNCGRA